jgi:cytoskeletal protein CcmA (bactofilin family)
MFDKRESGSLESRGLTIIEEGVLIEGKIYSKGSTKINGTVKGEIVSEKELIIGREGKVEANIKTDTLKVLGSFEGEMITSGEVEIASTGRFIGNLIQKGALLTIQKGGLFKGQSIVADNEDTFKKKSKKEICSEIEIIPKDMSLAGQI